MERKAGEGRSESLWGRQPIDGPVRSVGRGHPVQMGGRRPADFRLLCEAGSRIVYCERVVRMGGRE